jgi:parallel beta-helix repeat protein
MHPLSQVQGNSYIVEEINGVYHGFVNKGLGLPDYHNVNFVTLMNTLITALGTLAPVGGKILIKRGLYDNLMGHINITEDNITIEGEGKWQTILKLADDWDAAEPYPTTAFIHCENNNHYFTLKNVELDGNGLNQTFINNLPNPLVARCYAVNIWNAGASPFYALIENCYVHDFTVNGITVAGTYNIVRDCKVENNYANQITTSGASIGCKVHDNYCAGGADVNIALYGTNTQCYDNYLGNMAGTAGTTNSYDSMDIEGGNGALKPNHIHIHDNFINSHDAIHGIACYFQSDNLKIEDNFIVDINRAGATCFGIYLNDARKASITGNKIMNVDDYGIALYNSVDCFINGNHVDIAGAATAGISLNTTSYRHIVSANFISNTNGYGLMVGAGCNDNKFYGNYIRGNWADVNMSLTATGIIFENNYGYLTGGDIVVGKGQSTGMVVTKRLVLGAPAVASCDFNFASVADQLQQNINLGNIVPAKARVLQVEIVCVAAINVGDILMSAGNVSAGVQFITAGSVNALNEVRGVDLAATVMPVMNYAAASNIWIGGDPDNNWNTINTGKWNIFVTYIQYN